MDIETWKQDVRYFDLVDHLDQIEMLLMPRIKWFGPCRLSAYSPWYRRVFPFFGSDGPSGNSRYGFWFRRTLVIPFLGLGAAVVGLRWHYEFYETDE